MTIINNAYIHDEFGMKTNSELMAEHRFNNIFGSLPQVEQRRIKNVLSSIESVTARL